MAKTICAALLLIVAGLLGIAGIVFTTGFNRGPTYGFPSSLFGAIGLVSVCGVSSFIFGLLDTSRIKRYLFLTTFCGFLSAAFFCACEAWNMSSIRVVGPPRRTLAALSGTLPLLVVAGAFTPILLRCFRRLTVTRHPDVARPNSGSAGSELIPFGTVMVVALSMSVFVNSISDGSMAWYPSVFLAGMTIVISTVLILPLMLFAIRLDLRISGALSGIGLVVALGFAISEWNGEYYLFLNSDISWSFVASILGSCVLFFPIFSLRLLGYRLVLPPRPTRRPQDEEAI